MNEIKEWFSSIWNSEYPSQDMDTYSYEPISEIVSNEIKLRCENERKKGVVSYLYLGINEGNPYIKLVHRGVQNVIKEEKFMIKSCQGTSWSLRYQCYGNVEFVFIRMSRIIETIIKKNGWVIHYYVIDVKYNKDHPFTLFNKKDVKSERDDLCDLYKFEELFENAY